jgi:hypothetical protein
LHSVQFLNSRGCEKPGNRSINMNQQINLQFSKSFGKYESF